MKPVLLHGAAKAASRKKLIEIKQKFDLNNVVVFEEESIGTNIADNLMSNSLFAGERLVILENPPEDLVFDLSFISNRLSLILWFDHEVSEKKPIFEWVKKNNGEIIYFPEDREISVFPFLDLLAQGSKKAFLEMNKLKATGFDIFYFNTMAIYLLRNLLNTPKNAPHFVADKLQRQRAGFNQKKIINLYKNILELDSKLKRGLIESEQAEFLLVNKFISGVCL